MRENNQLLSALPPQYLSDVRVYRLGKASGRSCAPGASSVVVKKARQVIPTGKVSVECEGEVINE